MAIQIFSAHLHGFKASPVTIEVDLSKGLTGFKIVGLPDKAVEEARERVSAAVENSGAKPPEHHNRRVTINLAPAELKKRGAWFDLPIALAYLIASKQVWLVEPSRPLVVVGELGLDGRIRKVGGTIAAATLAKELNAILVLPRENVKEAALISRLPLIPVRSLEELITHCEEGFTQTETLKGAPAHSEDSAEDDWDFQFIRGQSSAKRALEIAAAGGHNVRMIGPPGSGKTLLARAFASILPPLSEKAMIEVTTIWSVAGLLPQGKPVIAMPPFRAPHHTASRASLIGGGSGRATPGEVTLAHRGVLFLDEIPEFPRHVLEALRQPLEDGIVTVSRSGGTMTYPARFTLLAAQNPCPCGNATDPERECICAAGDLIRYTRRLSGPLKDRIDMTIEVPRIPFKKLRDTHTAEPSAAIRKRVVRARKAQSRRLAELPFSLNAAMRTRDVEGFCAPTKEGEQLLEAAHDNLKLSPRAVTRILKVARTIADLAGEEFIAPPHIAEAIQYRQETAAAPF